MTVPISVVTVQPVGGSSRDISCDVADVSINHGRSSPDAQPDASTATVSMPLGMATDIEIGTHVSVISDGVTRFVGTVTDMATEWATRFDLEHGETTVVPVSVLIAAGPLADIGRRYVGDAPYPQELDGARVARILENVAGSVFTWSYDGTAPDGWTVDFFGSPLVDITTDDVYHALKIAWLPTSGFTFTNVPGFVVGETYTLVAEVLVPPGSPPVNISIVFIQSGPTVVPNGQWQTVSFDWTATQVNAPCGIGGVPAGNGGKFCYLRSYRVYRADSPPLGVIDPGTVQVLPRDVDRQPALSLSQEVGRDAAGVVWETRDGKLSYADAMHRANAPNELTLDACDVAMSPRWLRNRSGLINDVAIAYGTPTPPATEQPVVTATEPKSVARYGRSAYSLTTQLAALADAQAMAQLLMVRNANPVWLLDAIPVDLSVVDDATTAKLLALDVHSLLAITGFPAGGPSTSASLWVEGWTEEIAYRRHVTTLYVSGYCRTSPPPTWDRVPPEWTWDTVGGLVVTRNLVTNPSMEATAGGTVVVRENMMVNPVATTGTVGYGNNVVGGTETQTRQTGVTGLPYGVTTCVRNTWTALPSTNPAGGSRCVNLPAGSIIPGRTYTWSVWVRTSVPQRMLISCLWFDTGGAVVGSAATTPGVPLAANTWTRFSVTAVAPVGADTTRLDISATTGTGSQPWVIGDYVEQCLALCEESDVLGTEIFGDMTAATNGADWTYGWAGAVGNSRSQQKGPRVATYNPNDPARIFPSRSTDRAYVGTYSMRVVWAANGAPYFTATGLTVGKTYTMQSHVYVPAGSPQVDCGGNIGGAFPRGTNTGTVKDSWVRLVFTFTATATSHDLYPAWNVSSAATRGDDRCYVDAAQLEEGSVATDYFDGDTTDTTEHDYLWLGTPHASISQRAVGPVLTWDGSTCLGPLPSTGRWADVSASLRWDETDALITWDTWRG